MFKLSSTSLEQLNLRDGLSDPSAGAFASFEGRVRNHHDGRAVKLLEYEVFEALAQKEAQKIFEETRKRFSIIQAKCIHRTGTLQVGEMAVWVGVTAAHRDAAFSACRYIIDEVKKRVPVWKKEHYADGDSGWVNCPACSSLENNHSNNLSTK